DPLTDEDWPGGKRLDDGLPETLSDYIQQQGIRYFKVKISGDPDSDLKRLNRLWEIMPHERQPEVTLGANEAYQDAEQLFRFIERLERENLGLYQHVSFIEQPLARSAALEPRTESWMRRCVDRKPVVIDESDGTLDACRRALEIGYSGTSHKNCKGFFKSLANLGLLAQESLDGRHVIMSGEDLQNLPIVPLHQDLVSVGSLGITHCERNGHHYNFGLSMLPESEKKAVLAAHPDLYEQRGGEGFLKIRDGSIDCTSLHAPGYGVQNEPDWESMEPLQVWLKRRHPV
ncbi:MAG: enolase C-terminal domain-like protein, partial [Planctomycetota bacterium]